MGSMVWISKGGCGGRGSVSSLCVGLAVGVMSLVAMVRKWRGGAERVQEKNPDGFHRPGFFVFRNQDRVST
jgi:hypothetical protein